ncbi:hypothetical protein [Geobacter sp. SVR]|uniref:hypothetical protein n=1 Tax=Geobacter sp. SVR TaxID=2495594 RepID=UPI00143EF591|nr:hypothetical protein [Geobacter sp. SVR]BCS52030.1 hypothetical protein GSVR_03380 [Geobacter sp. SVR]GCF87156.1 hypothetical protein GSbR_37560 [Geobacter sp. SVR]
MKIFRNLNLQDETRYALRILLIMLIIPAVIFVLDLVLGKRMQTEEQNPAPEKRIIVTKSEEPAAPPPKMSPQVAASVREAISQGNYSTAYLELGRIPKDSPEYRELREQLVAERKKQRPGLRKEAAVAQGPLRYYDETTPRDRSTAWVFAYFSEQAGAFWPRFCIQVAPDKRLAITAFRILADGKTFDIPAAELHSEKIRDTWAQWYDAPLDSHTYNAILALIKARKASLLGYVSQSIAYRRDIGEAEKKGLERIMEAYVAVGGTLGFVGHGESKGSGKR